MSISDRYESTEPHKSVLVEEVLHYLAPRAGGVYLDVTFGSGGHTRALLEAEPKCRVIAFDWDEASIEKFAPPLREEFGDRLSVVWGNFALMYKILKKEGVKQVDGILADFGTSQMQISSAAGFSFNRPSPLDMRMSAAHQKLTAEEIINMWPERELIYLFKTLGEEMRARRIAYAICQERKCGKIKTTDRLAKIVAQVVGPPPRGGRWRTHPATKVFQALRIHVNKELDNIHSLLSAVPKHLVPGGRCVCISFHSLEDRLVKEAFIEYEQTGLGHIVTKRMVRAGEEELQENPSARSACLRVFEKAS